MAQEGVCIHTVSLKGLFLTVLLLLLLLFPVSIEVPEANIQAVSVTQIFTHSRM